MMRKLLAPLAMQIDPFWLRPDDHVVPIRRAPAISLAPLHGEERHTRNRGAPARSIEALPICEYPKSPLVDGRTSH